MAATAAAVASYFSATATRHPRSKLLHSSDSILRFACIQASPPMPTLTKLTVAHSRQHHRLPKISAAETATTAVKEREAEPAAAEEEEPVTETESVPEPEPVPVPAQNTKLYFGNLPYNCDSAILAGIIQEYASPEMVEVLYDRDTGRSRGFAFVTMSSVEDCETVIQNLDGSQYGGRTMRVHFSDKPKLKVPLYPESPYKLFVGNLSWSVTSESLTKAFEEHGNVVSARVLFDGDTGRSRGYGFVCYSTKEEMDAAMENLEGVELEGRALRISLALGKKS